MRGGISRTLLMTLLVVALLVAARVAAPHAIKWYANKQLAQMPDYIGHIQDVDLTLWRLAFQFDGFSLVKREGDVGVPFATIDTIDMKFDWRSVLVREIIGTVKVLRPTVNFVGGPDTPEEKKQLTLSIRWYSLVKDTLPFRINRVEVVNGKVHYRDFHSQPQVDVYLTSLQATATNLRNVEDRDGPKNSELTVTADVLRTGSLKWDASFETMAEVPDFDTDLRVENVRLKDLNDFLRAYAYLDAHGGEANVFLEVAGSEGGYEGYVKPVLVNPDILKASEDIQEGPFAFLWEVIGGLGAAIVEHGDTNRAGGRVPFSGRYENMDVEAWEGFLNILENAFGQGVGIGFGEQSSPEGDG